MKLLQQLRIFAGGKLAALIGVEDRRCTESVHGIAHSLQNGLYPQCIGEVPAHDFSAVPVDDGGEIYVTAMELDVGNVDGPDLVWEGNSLITQQMRSG